MMCTSENLDTLISDERLCSSSCETGKKVREKERWGRVKMMREKDKGKVGAREDDEGKG